MDTTDVRATRIAKAVATALMCGGAVGVLVALVADNQESALLFALAPLVAVFVVGVALYVAVAAPERG